MPPLWYQFPERVSPRKFVTLPSLSGLSELSEDVQYSRAIGHLSDRTYYPFLPAVGGKYRIRNLALGGPLQRHLEYRREAAGHIHSEKCCQVCFEIGEINRPIAWEYDVLMCQECRDEYTYSKFP